MKCNKCDKPATFFLGTSALCFECYEGRAVASGQKKRVHEKLCEKLHETYIAKNADYGDSFSDSFKEYGITAALVRMQDKWNRIKQLTKQEEKVRGEGIKDSLLDLAGYAIMTIMELEGMENRN